MARRRSRRRSGGAGGTSDTLTLVRLPLMAGVYRSDVLHVAKGLDMGLEVPRAGRDSLWDWIVADLPQSLSAFRMPKDRHVKEIADAGIRWMVVTFSVGFGQAVELPEQERLRTLIEVYHDHDIKVLGYLSMTNLFARRLFKDVPATEGWVQRDLQGRAIAYRGWPTDEDTRYLACVNHPDFRSHQLSLVRRAMRFGCDGLLVDNVFGTCHCDHCAAAFRAFSEERTGAARPLPKEDLAEADWSRPVIQLMADFFSESVERFFSDLRRAARRINRDAVCTYNVHPPRWRVRPLFHFPNLVRHCDLVLSEDGVLPASRDFKEVFETGQLRELSRSDLGRDNVDHYRYLRAVAGGRPYVFDAHHSDVTQPNHLRLALAEGWSCGGALGFAVPPGYLPERETNLDACREYLSFFNDHQDLYDGAEPVAQVALLVSHRSMMWALARDERDQPNEPIGTATHLWGFSQALIYNNVPFDYLLEEDLSARALAKYRVVVLPNAALLSDEALAAIDEHVRQGGNLVVTGETARFDAAFARRREYGLAHLTGVRTRRWTGDTRVVRRIMGKARVAHLLAPIPREYLLTSDPRLGRELAAIVRWCAHGRTLVRVRDLPGVLVIPNRVPGVSAEKGTGKSGDSMRHLPGPARFGNRYAVPRFPDRLVLHFLNYGRYPDRDEPIERAPVEVSLDEYLAFSGTPQVITPDTHRHRPRLRVKRAEDRTDLTLSRLRIYAVVVCEESGEDLAPDT